MVTAAVLVVLIARNVYKHSLCYVPKLETTLTTPESAVSKLGIGPDSLKNGFIVYTDDLIFSYIGIFAHHPDASSFYDERNEYRKVCLQNPISTIVSSGETFRGTFVSLPSMQISAFNIFVYGSKWQGANFQMGDCDYSGMVFWLYRRDEDHHVAMAAFKPDTYERAISWTYSKSYNKPCE